MNQLAPIIPNDDLQQKQMANRRRPSKDRDTVGRFKPDGRCKKHPKHAQSPGVCSLCLKEKLTLLSSSSSSSRKKTTSVTAGSYGSSSVSSLSSYYSSSSASSCASPPLPRFRNFTTEGKNSSNSLSIFLLSGKHGLVKSRSMAVVPRRRDGASGSGGGGGGDAHGKNTKKGGFWFKLLHPKSKRRMEENSKDTKQQLVHSTSVRETLTVAS